MADQNTIVSCLAVAVVLIILWVLYNNNVSPQRSHSKKQTNPKEKEL